MKQYLELLQTIKDKGVHKPAAREGMVGSTSLFGYQNRYNLSEGFPLVTTKKMYWKGVVVELLWFLRGDTNIKYLVDNGVNIWNEDAYNYYVNKSPAKNNDGIKQNCILQPVSLELHSREVSEELADSYSMFTFEEFIQKIKSTNREDLPSYKGYILGDCGYQYGKVWRNWEGYKEGEYVTEEQGRVYYSENIDQIKNVISSLKNSPEGRRHIVTAIDPAHDTDLALYWCHAMFQFNCRPISEMTRMKMCKGSLDNPITGPIVISGVSTDEENIPKYYLDCQLYQRSADVVLGVPFNIASYALLTHIIAKLCNMVPGDFIHTFGDVHIYDNHMDAVNEQLTREPRELPVFKFRNQIQWHHDLDILLNNIPDINEWLEEFNLQGYNPHPKLESETKLFTGLK